MRVGVISSGWTELPREGVRILTTPLDYATTFEAEHPIDYIPLERVAIERLLIDKARRATFVEAWGEFYIRAHVGVHQIHSRRASDAVARDVVGRDGAIQFYFDEPKIREMLLFRFAGQP